MKKPLSVSIPKPCHQDWSKMTPNEKGRFCNSCAKTVVDFTEKSVPETQEFLLENRHKKVCGHFYKKQLDTITIEIPEHVLYQHLSFSKLFLLVLLITMGTTLLSCNSSNGKQQKIDNIVLIDSLKAVEKHVDSLKLSSKENSIQKKNKASQKEDSNNLNITSKIAEEEIEIITLGMMIMGDIDEGILEEKPIEIEDIEEVVEGEQDDEIVFGMINEEPPQYWGAKNGSIEELKKSFSDSISKFVNTNFKIETTINLGLSPGKHKIWTQFTIDKEGNVTNIKATAPHKILENHAIEMLKKLPQFIPGKQRGKPVKVKYMMPIVFEIE